ncbi:MAG: hypothetical protein GOMPHAMPRED_006310 [Gomphillus americanus]|uniref:USP domain-containing protein n=1 Tax=Gomphillus americanus TaxID=1940652 RepID=A0A8H3ELA7_9LECA|nr:MAG: hypothetical protein GOMPHAMPRED_006310 [Gomphillus americanus]
MEDSSFQISPKPFRASSEGLSAPPRSSIEDGDASITRKRPRLDSEHRTYRSLSAEASSMLPTLKTTKPLEIQSTKEQVSGIMMEDQLQNCPNPRNKVTLNIKDTLPLNLNDETANHGDAYEQNQEMDVSEVAHENIQAPSSTPSSLGSPEIEVAEPEDAIGSIDPTIWKRAGERSLEQRRSALVDGFLIAQETEDYRHALGRIGMFLQWEESDLGPVFIQLSNFFDSWVSLADEYPKKIWELWSPDADFWHSIPTLIDGHIRKRASPATVLRAPASEIFSNEIDLTGDDTESSIAINNHARHDRDPVLRFFKTFVAVLCRLLVMDEQTLLETIDDSAEPELAAKSFIQIFNLYCSSFAPTTHSDHLWRIYSGGRWSAQNLIDGMVLEFLTSEGGENLVRCTTLLLNRSPTDLEYAAFSLSAAANVLLWASQIDKSNTEVIQRICKFVSTLYSTCQQKFEELIKKQVPGFTIEVAHKYMIGLADCIKNYCVLDYQQAIQLLPPDYDQELEGYLAHYVSDHNMAAELVSLKLRLDTALICLKNGRMESRIAGVEAYSELLLKIYKAYFSSRVEWENVHPMIACCRGFIKDRDLIGYLVSVDSHPQVVSRSKNIIGFQVATLCYAQKDTDTIWRAMRESKDPRRSEAIMEVLLAQVDYAGLAFLESFVEKLRGLPVEAYDGKMRHFVRDLLRSAAKNQATGKITESVCLQVLIPLLQNCLGYPDIPLKQKRELWQFAHIELEGNILDLSEMAKSEICEIAVKSIEGAQSSSTAGVALLSILLDCRYYGYDHNSQPFCLTESFAQLLIEDLSRCKQILAATGLEEDNIQEISKPRLALIEKALSSIPSWPFQKWMARLWQNLVGDCAVSAKARNDAFHVLAVVAKQALVVGRNDFLDVCICDFFQQLDSQFMTMTILHFAKEATDYYERYLRNASSVDGEDQALPGDMFWHIALKAQDPKLAEEAARHFVIVSLAIPYDTSYRIPEQNHARLVDRCVTYLTSAAVKIKGHIEKAHISEGESHSPSVSPNDLQLAKLQFCRALLVLKAFLEKIREKRIGSPVVRNDSPVSDHSIRGEEMVFTFYKHHDKASGSITIGSESPLRDLVARLCKIFKSSRVRIFASGQPVDQSANADKLLQDIHIFNTSKHLLVQKIPGGPPMRTTESNNTMLPLEQQVMIHFDKLYELLDLSDEIGKEICDFLMTFPPRQEVLSDSTPHLLPLSSPYKSMYCCYVLKRRLVLGLSEGAFCEDDLKRIVEGVGHALIELTAASVTSIASPTDNLLLHMTDCLSIALKEAVSQETSSSYLSDAKTFINSTITILDAALEDHKDKDRTPIVLNCFAIALEASLKNAEAWAAFREHEAMNNILKAVWLSSPNYELRSMTTKIVKGICAALPVLHSIDASDFLGYFWNQILALVSSSLEYPTQARQFFEVAMTIFRAATEHDASVMPLESYVNTWATLLLNHEPQGSSPGIDEDTVVDGLTDMLIWSLQIIKSKKQTFEGTRDLLHRLFTTHVFPTLSPLDDRTLAKIRIPVLTSSTRSKLYTLVMTLVSDQTTFQTLIKLMQVIIPHPTESGGLWSHGIAQIVEDNSDATWGIDRDKIVRADTGYAGLRNLSNTCYFNSLLEQLFMNVGFRSFMMQMHLEDPDKRQLLLYETQRLFAYMQETWLKSVDPLNVIENIITFDGETIDVHVQMDVDEFYNLLFDRWESQIVSEQDKKAFRRFYGGQLVQQIKSQDCPHVSERLEPFSVIQCEIQGKASLTDSLNAFIEGEMMQGDNKYKCTSCDGYVNAVKRACLKEVPDSLIFHLKRFDFDLVNGVRHKINDQFEFPMELDMAPYHVDHLQDPRNSPVPDKFMLVGVLVHSGSAEIGHYYSFIRERPGIKPKWIEMNDAEISKFEPSNIAQACFGGWDYGTNPPWMKAYNAYMLFYQRADSMESDAVTFPSAPEKPVRAQIPIEISNQIVIENEGWIRRYCLLDLGYLRFCRDVLEKHRDLYEEQCSDDHKLESRLIRGTITQIEHIFARAKDCKQIDELLRSLERLLRRCVHCTALFIKAITAEGTFRTLLFRCPNEIVKQKLADEIFHGLKMIKEQEPRLYDGGSVYAESPSSQDNTTLTFSAFHEIIGACDQTVNTITALAKGWDDFWAFMSRLAMRGKWERAQIHDREYFTKILQVICYNGEVPSVPEWTFANNYLKNRPRKRYAMGSIADLLVILLRGYLEVQNDPDAAERGERIIIAPLEYKILSHGATTVQGKTRVQMHAILLGFLSLKDIDASLYRDLMHCLLQWCDKDATILKYYQTALTKGAFIHARDAAPFLLATLAFAEFCPDDKLIQALVSRYAECISSIGDDGGVEHLEFFSRLRYVHNPHFANYRHLFFKRLVTKRLYLFAPYLVSYHEEKVRKGTTALANSLVFDIDLETMDDEEQAEEIQRNGKALTTACLERLAVIVSSRKLFDIRRLDDLIDMTRSGLSKFYTEDSEEDRMLWDRFQKCLDAVPEIAAVSPDGIESVEYSDSDELTDNSTTQA